MDRTAAVCVAVLALGLIPASGCLGDEPATTSSSPEAHGQPNASSNVSALWNGTNAQRLYEGEGSMTGFEADVLCTFGGGPKLDRIDRARVLLGTDRIEVHVELPPSYMGREVGWVLDGNGAEHSPAVDEPIHWLPTVGPGETATFEIPVEPSQTEQPGGELRWDFYIRVQPPNTPDQACYTGVGIGPASSTITAMRSA